MATGDKLTDLSELMFRQVHPHFYEGGILGSRAFKPNSSDDGFMSTDCASLIDAESAFIHYTDQMNKKSACVFAVTVGEFRDEDIDCTEDSIAATETIKANPAHCLADYRKHPEKSWKNISQRLKAIAEKRGCQYTPPSL